MLTGILISAAAVPVIIDREGFSLTLFPGSLYAELNIKGGVLFNEVLAKSCRDLLIEANPGKRYFLLVASEGFFRVNRKARKLGASKKYTAHLEAVAFYTTSVSLVLLGELFMKINKPTMPVGVFSSCDAALEWLNEKMEGSGMSALNPGSNITPKRKTKLKVMQASANQPRPNEPDKNVPTKPDPNPDPSRKMPERNDPTRIPDPGKNDPTRTTPPDPSKPGRS